MTGLFKRLIPKRFIKCSVMLFAWLAISVSPTWAQADPCDGDNVVELLAGSGEDLAVTGGCTIVKAGTYHYNNVNIYDGGILKFEDAAIDFWAQSILVENEGSLIAGSPEAPIGTAGGMVTIHLYGADQGARPFGTDQGPRGMGITCKTGAFCGVDPTIWNANYDSNTNQLKPKDQHVKSMLSGGEDYFYRYGTMPYDDGNPEAYFGYKVLGVSYGGTLKLFGKKGATYGDVDAANSGTSWVRLDKTLLSGQDTLVLDRPVDWAKDDHIVVTTTDYLPGHSEEFIIDTVSVDKKTITVTKTAEYTHNGDVFPLDAVPDRLGLDIHVNGQPAAETRAAVALLTRSIRIVSAGDDFGDPFPEPDVLVDSTEEPGTGKKHPYYFGGHTVIRQGVKAAQIQGVEFKQMGQGGRMGHYPIHFHLTRKAPPNTFVKDSSINESMTRWVVLHGAQNITLARNVGYKSIGHGFYLEDGTEINNKLYSNIGIFARAAVDNAQNPRQVPGILASAENPGIEQVPYHSDFQHPSVFWIMNGWNDFEYNMAAGATACGVCYWLVPGSNSGPSLEQQWDSYASLQTKFGNAGTTPLKKFEGNYCTSAMNSFNTVGNSAQCHGVGGVTGDVVLDLVPNPLVPRHQTPPTEAAIAAKYYPKVADAGSRIATNCYYNSENDKAAGAFLDDKGDLICSEVARCSGDNADTNCKVTVLDRYTTAFHWAQHNFSAVWLRPLWSLVQNSVISDVQNAGLTFVTGGDYTKASSPEGNWLLARKNVFIGHTQDDNPYASDAGPFNPQGLACDSRSETTYYCISKKEGISVPIDNWAVNQRLFNIYDGPAQQESNAFLNITKTYLEKDKCTRGQGSCKDSRYIYGRVHGVLYDDGPRENEEEGRCYLPNAAIAWKQPNGFYYPPSFHSRNLYFEDVEIRHFVVEPLFEPGTRISNRDAVLATYCTHGLEGTFNDYTSVDRQTVLNDDDGSLTGLVNTLSVNEDPFFNAPVETVECLSDGTAKTSPYQYLTTAIYPDCAVKERENCGVNGEGSPPVDWGQACSDPNCYGVPLYRQYLTDEEISGQAAPNIRLMGQGIWQRSNLTPNHGMFYIDTTVSREVQEDTLSISRPPPVGPQAINPHQLNVFQGGETYYVYLVYATPETEQTYQIYVGKDFDINTLQAVTTPLKTANLTFAENAWPSVWAAEHDNGTGVLSVNMDMGFSQFSENYTKARENSCQPKSFCALNANKQCVSSPQFRADHPELSATQIKEYDAACAWAGVDVDCPEGGCYGFAFTLPDTFKTLTAAERANPSLNPRPPAKLFPDEHWRITPTGEKLFTLATPDLAGADCKNPDGTEGNTKNTYITGTALSERILGTEGDDIIEGFGGDDQIIGLGGNDWISGGTGNDVLLGGEGDDEMHGDDGADLIQGDDGDDLMFGGAGDDILSGGAGADLLLGNAGDDLLQGDAGNDMLFGDEGEDVLIGGAGDDALLGGAGEDLINAGTGNDTCAAVAPASGCETAF